MAGRIVGAPVAHGFGRTVGAYDRGDAAGGRAVHKPADGASYGRRVGKFEKPAGAVAPAEAAAAGANAVRGKSAEHRHTV